MHAIPLRKLATGAAVAAGALVLSASAATADPATDLLTHTNAVRAASGLAPLTPDDSLTTVADSWSGQMATTGDLAHNPSLSAGTKLGENVGEGSDVGTIARAFDASPHHRANILDPDFRSVGFGVAQSANGVYWVTADFA